jgi:hypothetical protein
LAYAVVKVVVWVLWWDKPLGVQRGIVVWFPSPNSADSDSNSNVHPNPNTNLDSSLNSNFPPLALSGAVRLEQETRSFSFLAPLLGPSPAAYDPLASTAVPALWSLPLPPNTQLAALGITTLVGTIFGGIHCAAWLTSYSTPVETWLWRSCSAAITVLPAALMGHVVLSRTVQFNFLLNRGIEPQIKNRFQHRVGNVLKRVRGAVAPILIWSEIPVYIAARLVLIVLPLMALRRLPPSAFVEVDWGVYIPHMGLLSG